jgi:predicted amidophosphoribosyltransferase
MGWGYKPNLLVKKRTTVAQTELKRQARLNNLQNVFSLNPEKHFPKKKFFLLFDDIWTTGSTLKEACKVLKQAGATKVCGLTLAKTN